MALRTSNWPQAFTATRDSADNSKYPAYRNGPPWRNACKYIPRKPAEKTALCPEEDLKQKLSLWIDTNL